VLTDIGQSLIKGMVEHMLNDIKASWSKVVQLEPRLEDSTVNHHWVQMMMGNSRVMSITFEVTLLEHTGTMSVYIPFSTLKPVAQVLNPHVWIAGPDDHRMDAGLRQRNLTAVKQVTVPFRVFLGGAELPLGDLMNLQPGDVICLETPVRQELPVWVADAPRFRCRPGTVGRRLAVQISQVIQPETAS
jgi:flagellar motor switch protein FliM